MVWIGSAHDDYVRFPLEVQDDMGYRLWRIQNGEMPPHNKPLKGLGGGVFEVADNHDGDTFRAVYTIRIRDKLCILHCFQKKSSSGSATPRPDLALIKQRLAQAEKEYGR